MPSSMTVTGTAGPGKTVSAQLYTGVTKFEYEVAPKGIIRIFHDRGITEIVIDAQSTWTTTLSSGNITVTIS